MNRDIGYWKKLISKLGFLSFWVHIEEKDQAAYTFVETIFILPTSLHVSSATHSLPEYVGDAWLCALCQCWHDACHGNLQAVGLTFVSLWPDAVGVRVFSRVPGCRLGKSARLYGSRRLWFRRICPHGSTFAILRFKIPICRTTNDEKYWLLILKK